MSLHDRIEEPSLVNLKPMQNLVTLVLRDRFTQRPFLSNKRHDIGTFLLLIFVLCSETFSTIVVVTVEI